jgi:double-stranded uracil-DNA glycosylase
MSTLHKPTKEEIRAAFGKTIPDIIAPNLSVLFCGINPSLYSVAVGHHFARPGNRFWPTLQAAGFTKRLLTPFEDGALLEHGYGLTNMAGRATARADQLEVQELLTGQKQLLKKAQDYRPQVVAVLGVSAYRTAFNQPKATLGQQEEKIGDALVWVLPNPSGLNAHYQKNALKQIYQELRSFVNKSGRS